MQTMPMQAIAQALKPWGMSPPRTVRGFDQMFDTFVALAERDPDNPRVHRVLRAMGELMCQPGQLEAVLMG
jgi:hypothetical protein